MNRIKIKEIGFKDIKETNLMGKNKAMYIHGVLSPYQECLSIILLDIDEYLIAIIKQNIA